MGRVAAAPESGLLLVILLMGVSLTLAAPSISRVERVALPSSAQVDDSADDRIVVDHGGMKTEYRRTDGWELQPFPAPGVLVRPVVVDQFLNRDNLVGIAKDASFIAVMAVGITGIIILGGIDLSVGSVYALAGVVGAFALRALESSSDGGASAWVAIPLGLGVCAAVGGACGLVNGAATVGLRVHPFIITLGGLAAYRGVAFVLTDGQSISGLPSSFVTGFFKARVFGVNPVPMLFMLVSAAAGWFVLSRTVFGRQTFAVGGNEIAAKYAGVRVGRVKTLWFTIGGMLAGVSAAMALGYYGAVSSDSGNGYELRVIAAAVVGGASLSGGRGSAVGAMLGAVVIQMIDNGIVILGLSNYTNIVIGLVIVLAVVVDQAKQRLTSNVR